MLFIKAILYLADYSLLWLSKHKLLLVDPFFVKGGGKMTAIGIDYDVKERDFYC